MRLYFVSTTDLNGKTSSAWCGTGADARKQRIEFEKPFKELNPNARPVATVQEIDVPTDKQGLMAFLNDLTS